MCLDLSIRLPQDVWIHDILQHPNWINSLTAFTLQCVMLLQNNCITEFTRSPVIIDAAAKPSDSFCLGP